VRKSVIHMLLRQPDDLRSKTYYESKEGKPIRNL